jgi:hypothetical protein
MRITFVIFLEKIVTHEGMVLVQGSVTFPNGKTETIINANNLI